MCFNSTKVVQKRQGWETQIKKGLLSYEYNYAEITFSIIWKLKYIKNKSNYVIFSIIRTIEICKVLSPASQVLKDCFTHLKRTYINEFYTFSNLS